MVRNDLLVAPALVEEEQRKTRRLYLPYPDGWFPMNLRPDDPIGEALAPMVDGGNRIDYSCLISDQDSQLPYITPMYIREGMIKLVTYMGTHANELCRRHNPEDWSQRLYSGSFVAEAGTESNHPPCIPRERQCETMLR
jgi:hypothetical protein